MAAAKMSSMGTVIHEKDKAERAITEIQSRMSGPIIPEDERVSTLAAGNNFETEKASEGVPSQKIIQSKENIILSEISSIKNMKWATLRPQKNHGSLTAVSKDKILHLRNVWLNFCLAEFDMSLRSWCIGELWLSVFDFELKIQNYIIINNGPGLLLLV